MVALSLFTSKLFDGMTRNEYPFMFYVLFYIIFNDKWFVRAPLINDLVHKYSIQGSTESSLSKLGDTLKGVQKVLRITLIE